MKQLLIMFTPIDNHDEPLQFQVALLNNDIGRIGVGRI